MFKKPGSVEGFVVYLYMAMIEVCGVLGI